jgi:mRNA-degrading endonuclease RelE of RelBE toxin-antitoxin system
MRRRFAWTDEARADLRRIWKEQALTILKALTRFADEGVGDIKKPTDDPRERYRFRFGDHRGLFRFEKDTIHVLSVEDRRDAYR